MRLKAGGKILDAPPHVVYFICIFGENSVPSTNRPLTELKTITKSLSYVQPTPLAQKSRLRTSLLFEEKETVAPGNGIKLLIVTGSRSRMVPENTALLVSETLMAGENFPLVNFLFSSSLEISVKLKDSMLYI